MNYPFDLIVQHHEGAGAPSDNVVRFAEGGYSYGIGVNGWANFRQPQDDYSTMDFNHVSMGVCLSGDRMVYPVTDKDLVMMREIGDHARSQGWIVDAPQVNAHRNMPGSSTVCPGNMTMERWPQVEAAYQKSVTPPPVGDDVPADKDFVDAVETSEGAWKLQYDGGVQTIRGPFYGSYFSLPASVRNDPLRRFLAIVGNDGPGYSIVSLKGEVYAFTVKQ